jgi:hypothetical protein
MNVASVLPWKPGSRRRQVVAWCCPNCGSVHIEAEARKHRTRYLRCVDPDCRHRWKEVADGATRRVYAA